MAKTTSTSLPPAVPLFLSSLPWSQKVWLLIQSVIKKINSGNITLASKAIVYYSLLSFFPLLSLVGSLIPWFHIDVQTVLAYLQTMIPDPFQKWINPLVVKILTKTSGGVLSFGIFGVLWSSSGVVNILQRSVNSVYGFDNQKLYTQQSWLNFILMRVFSIFITAISIVILLFGMVSLILGQQILNWLKPVASWAPAIINQFVRWRWPVTLLGLMALLTTAYLLLPNSRKKWRYIWPGAVFATAGFIVLVQGFTLYLHYFGNRWNSYGTLGLFFVLIIWLNLAGLIFLVGSAINAAVTEAWTGQIKQDSRWIRRRRSKERLL
ncbi:YihY/virulence factor BrkB family protein [Lactobacillus sp. DCY120]|uniref:YihY/virulence factor BrkB family protein n=1 Tax=Bombilactobacillus apium TaxID=2675299 RepID=A0A850R1F1_9LACO|nr:YihY/virulence factor BrkB family protein [Bombilactobacillus apium]NVY96753.1 YihY/virulence factor BrkB family protein [Bombilactobacillus apium]